MKKQQFGSEMLTVTVWIVSEPEMQPMLVQYQFMTWPTEVSLLMSITIYLLDPLFTGLVGLRVCVYLSYLVITNFASISLYLDLHIIAVGAKVSIKFLHP